MSKKAVPVKMLWGEYRRRSSDEKSNKQNVSLPRQRSELVSKFSTNVYKRVWDDEESKSAFHPYNRPKFDQLIELIEKGEVNGLIAYHPNRLSRNPEEAGKIVQLIVNKKILDIKFATYTFDNSPEGILILQFALSQSQYESQKLSRDVNSGNKFKFFDLQQWSGPAKQGFINYTDPYTKKRNIQIDLDRFDLLREAGKQIVSGKFTPLEALDWLNKDMGYTTIRQRKQGGGPLSKSTFYRYLADPFYYGVMEHKVEGNMETTEHNYQKMFSKDEWDIIQVRLGRKSRSKQKIHDFAFKGVMNCGECNGFVTAEEKWQMICPDCKKKFAKTRNRNNCTQCGLKIELMKNPTILHYVYYHCTKKITKNCTQGFLEIGELEKQVDRELQRFEVDPDFKDWAIKHLGELNDEKVKEDEKATKRNTDNYENLKSKLRRMSEYRFSDSFENASQEEKEVYEESLEKLKNEIESVKGTMQTTDEKQYDWLELSRKTFEFACYARYWFQKGDVKTKTQILQLLGQNLKLHNKKVLVDKENLWWLIEKAKEETDLIGVSLEPTKMAGLSDINVYLDPAIPTLLRD